MSVNINAKLRIKGVTTGGGGGGNTPVTFITSRSVGQFISISITTSTGYWKSNHNGTDSTVFTSGPFSNLTVQNANGEFTIIPCDIIGNPSGDITGMLLGNTFFNQNQITTFDGTGLSNLTELGLGYNQLTSFNGNGLTGLTSLNLEYNQLTTFNGTGLSSLTNLNLRNNQFTSFDATGLTSLTDLRLNDNQLTSVNVSGLTSLALLNLFNNQLTSIDVSSLTNLTNLSVNGNLLDSADNDLILAQLVANGKNNGSAATTGGRTPAGDNDFNTLQNRGWFLQGFSDNTTTTTTTSGPTTTTTTTQNNQYFTVGGQLFNPSDVSFYLTNTLNRLSAQLGTTVYLAARRAIDGQYSVLDPNNMYRTMTTIFGYPMNLIPVWTETLPSLPSGTYYLYYFELVDSNGNMIYRYPMVFSRP